MYNDNDTENGSAYTGASAFSADEELQPAVNPDTQPAQDAPFVQEPTPTYNAAAAPADGSYRYSYTSRNTDAVPPVPPVTPPEQAKKEKHHHSLPLGAVIAICVCAVLIVGVATAFITAAVLTHAGSRADAAQAEETAEEPEETEVPQLTTSTMSDSAVNEAAAYVYSLATKQVVGITTDITYYNVFGQSTSASVSGSGFILTDDGYILTNYHVIEDAYEGGYAVTVMMYDESTYDAEIVGFDEDSDIALLKIDATGLSAAELGESEELAVGTVVYAVGNPLGELNYSMTSGIISATDRTITTEDNVAVNMFQIDAAVNSGNSGGPVYNSQGQVIGIVTAKYASSGVEGLGFAIPISDAVHIANQILQYGYVTDKATLNVETTTVTAAIAQHYNMVQGAYISAIDSGSCAETAGLQVGDIITAVDDTDVTGSSELTGIVNSYKAGDTASITVWRSGETKTLTVTFDEKQPEPEADTATTQDQGRNQQNGQSGYGYYSGDMDDILRQFFGYGYGY